MCVLPYSMRSMMNSTSRRYPFNLNSSQISLPMLCLLRWTTHDARRTTCNSASDHMYQRFGPPRVTALRNYRIEICATIHATRGLYICDAVCFPSEE
jgi:hypothetical protein